jgi:hypothetical protein
VVCNTDPDIGETNKADRPRPLAMDQHRHAFAGMIGAAPCRVIAVISRHQN